MLERPTIRTVPLVPPHPWSCPMFPPLGPSAREPCACQRLPKKSHRLRVFVWPNMNRLPVILAGRRIDILLAKKADLVGLHQGVGVGRISVELAVVELDRAKYCLPRCMVSRFAVALNVFPDARHGDGERRMKMASINMTATRM